ncbi:MAG: hypothetical protein WDW36_007905 [Sanguina aurantia]
MLAGCIQPTVACKVVELSVHSSELVIAATSGLSSASLHAAAPWELLLLVRDLAQTNKEHGLPSTFPAHRWVPALMTMANMQWPAVTGNTHGRGDTTNSGGGNTSRGSSSTGRGANSSSSSRTGGGLGGCAGTAESQRIPHSRQHYDNPLTWLSNISHSLAMLGDQGRALLPAFHTAMCRNAGHLQALHPSELAAVATHLAASGVGCDRERHPTSGATHSPAGDTSSLGFHGGGAQQQEKSCGVGGVGEHGVVGLHAREAEGSEVHVFLHHLCDLVVLGVDSLTANEAADALKAFASLRLPSQLWFLPLTRIIQPNLRRLSNRSLCGVLQSLAATPGLEAAEASGFLHLAAGVVVRNQLTNPAQRNLPGMIASLQSLREQLQFLPDQAPGRGAPTAGVPATGVTADG